MTTSNLLNPRHVFWSLAFRPLFFLAALLAVVAMGAWLLMLNSSLIPARPALPLLLWHIHEMLFGFGFTVAAGFLLTAAQNWTGLRSPHGLYLMVLAGLWLLMRGLLWLDVPVMVLLLAQAIWWLMVIVGLGMLLIPASSRRNYQFLPILVVIASLNLCFLWFARQGQEVLAVHLARSALLFFCLVMGIVGGRVIPMFTRNAVPHSNVRATPRLNWVLLLFSILGACAYLLHGVVPSPVSPAWVLMLVAVLHLIRLAHWGGWHCRHEALLWSLHLSYLALGLGVFFFGLAHTGYWFGQSEALHLITVGAMGFMILSMISRVSLGHSGRPLHASNVMAIAFGLMAAAACVRVLLPLFDWLLLGWNLSGLLWIAAFSLFLLAYIPVLTGPDFRGR